MFRTLTAAVAATALMVFAPAFSSFEGWDGAAFANNGNGNGNGGGNGGGNGNAGGNGNGNGNNGAANGNSAKASNGNGSAASGLGKMNGAMHASINAVIAHIKNGQTTNGPVGLLAGLAVADADAVATAAALADLQGAADAFGALGEAVTAAGFASVEDYLQAKVDGTATPEQIAALDPLVDAAGGTTEDGLALAETAPTAEDIAAADAAATAAAAAVTEVETAIGDAWNKDGDLAGLLGDLRGRLVGYEDDIAAAMTAGETN